MMAFCLMSCHSSRCHAHVLWETDAEIFHADEAHLNLKTQKEREKSRGLSDICKCLCFLNKRRSTDQPDETNVKKIQSLCASASVCVCVRIFVFTYLAYVRTNSRHVLLIPHFPLI